MKFYVVAITDNIQVNGVPLTEEEIDSVLSQWVDAAGAFLLEVSIDPHISIAPDGTVQGNKSTIRVVSVNE